MFIPEKHKSDLGDNLNNFSSRTVKVPFSKMQYKRSYWNFFQGNLNMLFVTLLFKSRRCTFLITHAPLTVECQYLVHEINVTQGALSLIFVSGNLKMHP